MSSLPTGLLLYCLLSIVISHTQYNANVHTTSMHHQTRRHLLQSERTINGMWSDDYTIGQPGWQVTQQPGTVTVSTDTGNTYHGPYDDGDTNSNSYEQFNLTQQFYCQYRSSVEVSYKMAYCGTEIGDKVNLYLNDILVQSTSGVAAGSDLIDTALPPSTCGGIWTQISYGPFIIPEVMVNTLFKVKFQLIITHINDEIVVWDAQIICNAFPTIDPTESPTVSPTKRPTRDPTNRPTINPSKDPTTAPPTHHPSALTLNPTTGTPTSSPTKNPTASPTNNPTSSPITAAPTTTMPTCDPSGTCPPTSDPTTSTPTTATPTSYPTESPSVSPTQRPTRSPTQRPTVPSISPTQYPSTEPTLEPTIHPTMDICNDWEINIIFTLLRYIQVDNWQNILKGLCLKAFKQTVILLSVNIWDKDWCVNIDIQFSTSVNRRVLLQNNIGVDADFIINDILYNNYFDNYNATTFSIEFQRILVDLIGQNVNDIDDLVISDPINIKSASIPTYAPNILETEESDSDRSLIIGILFAIFVPLCCIVIFYACRLFYKHEKKYETSYVLTQQNTPITPITPTTPTTPTTPVTPKKSEMAVNMATAIEMGKQNEMDMDNDNKNDDQDETMDVKEDEMISKKKTSFELHLTDNVVATDVLLDDILSDIASDNDMDDDDDMINYGQTPQ